MGLVMPLIVLLHRMAQPADDIVGTACRHGDCAAQGMPIESVVDTGPHVVTTAEA